MVDPGIGPILTHGAVEATNRVLRGQGIALPDTVQVTPELDLKAHAGALVVAPPSALGGPWLRRFGTVSTAFASGWMALRGVRRRRGMEKGFVISDHADWAGLNEAIRATGAERVLVTHGYTSVFARWLAEQGYDAGGLETEYEGEGQRATRPGMAHEAVCRGSFWLDGTTRTNAKVAALAEYFPRRRNGTGCGPWRCCRGGVRNGR
jgi:putative mRNA 3-end processing factor